MLAIISHESSLTFIILSLSLDFFLVRLSILLESSSQPFHPPTFLRIGSRTEMGTDISDRSPRLTSIFFRRRLTTFSLLVTPQILSCNITWSCSLHPHRIPPSSHHLILPPLSRCPTHHIFYVSTTPLSIHNRVGRWKGRRGDRGVYSSPSLSLNEKRRLALLIRSRILHFHINRCLSDLLPFLILPHPHSSSFDTGPLLLLMNALFFIIPFLLPLNPVPLF